VRKGIIFSFFKNIKILEIRLFLDFSLLNFFIIYSCDSALLHYRLQKRRKRSIEFSCFLFIKIDEIPGFFVKKEEAVIPRKTRHDIK